MLDTASTVFESVTYALSYLHPIRKLLAKNWSTANDDAEEHANSPQAVT